MNTDHLIRAMAADTRRTRPVGSVLPVALVVSALLCGGLYLALMGVRPDVWRALTHLDTLLKPLLPLVLAVGAFGAALRLSRPGASPGIWRFVLAMAPVAVVLAMLVAGHGLSPVELGTAMIGTSLVTCVTSIPLISLPVAAASLWALRRGASTRPRLTGAVAGLMSAGAGATMYSLYCSDDNPLFYGTWYSVSILAVTLVTAYAGGRLLRW